MVTYLQEWLGMRAGAAPIFATFVNGKDGNYIMRRVDNSGIVLVTKEDPDQGIAYPWTAIFSIARVK